MMMTAMMMLGWIETTPSTPISPLPRPNLSKKTPLPPSQPSPQPKQQYQKIFAQIRKNKDKPISNPDKTTQSPNPHKSTSPSSDNNTQKSLLHNENTDDILRRAANKRLLLPNDNDAVDSSEWDEPPIPKQPPS